MHNEIKRSTETQNMGKQQNVGMVFCPAGPEGGSLGATSAMVARHRAWARAAILLLCWLPRCQQQLPSH